MHTFTLVIRSEDPEEVPILLDAVKSELLSKSSEDFDLLTGGAKDTETEYWFSIHKEKE